MRPGRVEPQRRVEQLRVALLDAAARPRPRSRCCPGETTLARTPRPASWKRQALRCSRRSPSSSSRTGPAAKSTSRPGDAGDGDDRAVAAAPPGAAAPPCARRTVCIRSTSKRGVPVLLRVGDGQRADVRHDGVEPAEPLRGRSPPRPVSAAPSRTSSSTPRTPSPRPASAFSVAAISPASRAQNSTAAPSATNASTIARPMPRVPPVTSTRDAGQLQIHGRLLLEHGQSRRGALTRRSACRPPYAVAGGQQRLARLDDGAVVRVDDVGDRRLA